MIPPSFIGRTAMILLGTAMISGCATTDMQATMGSLSELGKTLATPPGQQHGVAVRSSGGMQGKSLKETALLGALRQNLSTDGSAPEWPKVVITDLSFPTSQLDMARSFQLKQDDCVTFNAVLWRDEKHNERFNSIYLCAADLPKQSNNFVTTWRSFPISGKTTGQARTDGPTPPYSKLPGDPKMDQWMTAPFGMYFIGSTLTLVGYDDTFPIDNRRFWVRNVK